MKRKLLAILLAVATLTSVCAAGAAVSAAEPAPLVYQADGKLDGNETFAYELSQAQQVTGNALAVRLFVKNTYNDAFPLAVSFTADGKEYSWTEKSGTLTGIEYNAEGEPSQRTLQWREGGAVDVPYLFNGEVILPFSLLGDVQISEISALKMLFTCSANSQFASGDTWLADNVCLYFYGIDCVTVEEDGTLSETRTELADFTKTGTEGVTLSAASGQPVGQLRTATEEDMVVAEAFIAQYNASCETIGDVKLVESFDFGDEFAGIADGRTADELYRHFYLSGQESDYSLTAGEGEGNSLLSYNCDSLVYDAGRNSYAGVHFNFSKKDATDWSGAKGVTVYVENTADYLVSFAVEIFQFNTKTGLLEQYNLNDVANKYKTLYAYNVETGEEFSYHTQTFMRIPANFKGWIRIPFSQYAAPAWSLAPAYGNEGVLDFDANPVVKISLTRLFNVNLDATLLIDNIGLYYSDFGVGNLFDDSVPSIRQCLEEGTVA